MSEVFCKVILSQCFKVEIKSFLNSSLRVAEMVWAEGNLIKEYPPEAHTIKCLDDTWALLETEDGQSRLYLIHS